MADNYLEKKMEEHRRGVTAKAVGRRLSPVGERRGTVSFKIDELRVLVTDASTETGMAIVRRLREGGCKVAFVTKEEKAGRELAQSSGARYYPVSFNGSVTEDIVQAWGNIDVIVATDGERVDEAGAKKIILVGESPEIFLMRNTAVNAVDTATLTPAEVAHLCLFLCLKESACLNGVTLGNQVLI